MGRPLKQLAWGHLKFNLIICSTIISKICPYRKWPSRTAINQCFNDNSLKPKKQSLALCVCLAIQSQATATESLLAFSPFIMQTIPECNSKATVISALRVKKECPTTKCKCKRQTGYWVACNSCDGWFHLDGCRLHTQDNTGRGSACSVSINDTCFYWFCYDLCYSTLLSLEIWLPTDNHTPSESVQTEIITEKYGAHTSRVQDGYDENCKSIFEWFHRNVKPSWPPESRFGAQKICYINHNYVKNVKNKSSFRWFVRTLLLSNSSSLKDA